MERNSFFIITKELATDKRISATAKLLLAALADHRNKKTGQCNPWQSTLAEELGTSEDIVQRGLQELRKFGFIKMKRGQKGCSYEVSHPRICGSHPRICGWEPPYPLYEPYIKNHTARDRAALPQKKSIQRETLERYYATYEKAGGR